MPYDHLTRVLWKMRPGAPLEKQVYITQTEMSEEALRQVIDERKVLITGMVRGGAPFLDGMEKLFGELDPELKEQIDRARRMGR